MKRFPIITLTTDFGSKDHYVGTMKGAILSLCPEAQIVDITHDIEPFAILSAAYAIHQAAPYFPLGTIHVVVVDPGVGTARKPLLAEAMGHTFIAPDNGVLTMILAQDPNARIRELTNRRLWFDFPSSTFHGRDIFSPVAAALASGRAKPKNVGPRAENPELLANISPKESTPGNWRGTVLHVDRFGNLITNFKSPDMESREFQLRVGKLLIGRQHKTFGDAPAGVLFSYPGSSGYLEIGMNRGSAAKKLKANPGAALTLRVTERVHN